MVTDDCEISRHRSKSRAAIALLQELSALGIADGSRAAYVTARAMPEPARPGKVECHVFYASTAAATRERLGRATFKLVTVALHRWQMDSNQAAWNCGWKEGFAVALLN